ncbi:MAG: ATP-binding protein [Trueperaceae bacterium]
MTQNAAPILLAMASEERGGSMLPMVSELGYSSMVVNDVEALLYHTRGSVPTAIVIEHALIAKVSQLDLISLLRRRKSLIEVPMLVLGPDKPEIHAASLASGANQYLNLPTHPVILKANLKHLLDLHGRNVALRVRLEQLLEMEKNLQESERVKDDLIHMLVHDLKSPISSVMGLLDHSLDMMKDSSAVTTILEMLSLARAESQHLLNLAANILDVRRMKDGLMPYNPSLVESLSDLAKLAQQDVSGAPRERNLSFIVQSEAETLYADPNLLRRILANLLSNAIKHTRRGGHIDFRALKDKEQGAYVLSVRDDGEGIPEADLKRIFNAFEQSRHTVHDRYDTGMGLTFCKMAIEKHGGKIWVESKVGRGSTFFMTIPFSVKEEAEQRLLAEAPLV